MPAHVACSSAGEQRVPVLQGRVLPPACPSGCVCLLGACLQCVHTRVLGNGSAPPCAAAPLSVPSAELDESSHFVIGAVLYRTLGLILPPPR